MRHWLQKNIGAGGSKAALVSADMLMVPVLEHWGHCKKLLLFVKSVCNMEVNSSVRRSFGAGTAAGLRFLIE